MNLHEIELALCDIVIRHGVQHVGLSVDQFTAPYARQVWASILDLYARDEAPTLRGVHAQMLDRGHHIDDRDAARLVFLPLGHLADIEDLVAIVSERGRLLSLRIDRQAA